MKHIYTTSSAAALLNSHKDSIARLCRTSKIKSYKKLGKWFILHSDLIDWIKEA